MEKLIRNTGRWNVNKSSRYILLAAVPVNVHKENHLSIIQKVTKHAFGEENRRMHLAAGFVPEAVQVLPCQRASVVAHDDSIGIQHGNDLKNKVVPENSRIHRGTSQIIQDALMSDWNSVFKKDVTGHVHQKMEDYVTTKKQITNHEY